MLRRLQINRMRCWKLWTEIMEESGKYGNGK